MNEVSLLGSRYPLIRDMGTTLTRTGWIHPDRVTDYHVFIYCIEGQMQVIEDGTEFFLRDGDILFLKKGIHHWGEEGTLPGTSTIWIHFYDSVPALPDTQDTEHPAFQHLHMVPTFNMFTPGTYEFSLPLPKYFNIQKYPYIAKRIREVYELYTSARPFRHLYLSMETMSVFLELYNASQQKESFGKADVLVQKLISYLEDHSGQMLDTEQIREDFQLNYNYLSTLFKAKLGTSIFKFHERQRVQKAAELLKTTSMNITEISYHLEFKSPYYFSRVFKKVMGESPSDYIKNIYRMR
ncbi:helix-turn-helix domain-containing protein [Paenibacillus gansuensis]|uniref:Helix-turn-helix domain-containing protein n=1 Tax=Paenibacillus gansuensis TaxID=306542 RepID=A0ABW5P8H3_9BACL